jgi:hypothetical protein
MQPQPKTLAEQLKDTVTYECFNPPANPSAFTVQSGNSWLTDAQQAQSPKPLINHLWFLHELCIFFADTGLGKTIYATQEATRICQEEKQPVLVIDFELTPKQFELRYSVNGTQHYPFPPNFYRAEVNPDTADFEAYGYQSFEDYLYASIQQAIVSTGASIVIIDNITWLNDETEKAKYALSLMKHLKALKNMYNLSLLVLAHTPKRDLSKPITRNCLAGSKMLINFCDSAFAMGESVKGTGMRYIKQIKARNEQIVYDGDNVAVYEIQKPHNFLRMVHVGLSTEREHLRHRGDKKEELAEPAKQMHAEGKTMREIATALGVSTSTVHSYLHG